MNILRRGTRTARRILDGLLVSLIVVVVLAVILGRVVPLTGRTTLVIGGGSMEPAIPLGAAVVIEPVDGSKLQVGDVVSLRSGPGLEHIFTHRITRIVDRADGRWVETKGDANATIDPAITPATNVIGRAVLTVPLAGYLIRLLSIPSGVILVVLLTLVILVIVWLLESFEIEPRRSPSPAGEQPVTVRDGRPPRVMRHRAANRRRALGGRGD